MVFGRKDSVDASEFWKEREETLGTPVLKRVLGQVIREDNRIPLWGLFYTTAQAVYFQTFQSDNWLSTVFSGGKKGAGRTKDETIEIPSSSIQVFRVKPRKKTFISFFGKPPIVELVWKAPGGETKALLFEMEGDADAFVASLERP
jgi:hypothetical protein